MSSQERDISHPVPANFRAEQDRLHWSNQQAARALDVSERQVTRWRGGQIAGHVFVLRMAKVFGRDIAWFYTDHSIETAAA